MKAEDLVNELHESDIFYEYIMNYFKKQQDINKPAIAAHIIGHGKDSTGRWKLSNMLHKLSPEGVKAQLHEFLSDIDPKHAQEIIDKLKIAKD